ncbi:hypothetical protein [Photobacterium damselae]
MKTRNLVSYLLLPMSLTLPSGNTYSDVFLQAVSSIEIPSEYKDQIIEEKLAQEGRTLQQRLAEVEAKNKTLTEAHQAESTTRERIERELVEAQSQATKAHAQLTALKARSAEQQKLAQESRTLQQRLAEVEAKNKTLTEAHQAESTTRERIERELVEAQSQATKAHAQLTALKARSAEQQKLAQESRTLQQRLAEVEAKNKTLTEAHQAESTTRERIERELVEAQSQATKAHAQLTALKARSAEQQKLAQESRTLQQRLAEVEAKNKTLTEAHQAESTTRERIERELVEAQSQATKAHAQLTALKARSAEQQKLAQESRTLQQRLAEVEAKNKTLTEAHQAESTTRERIERELVEAQSQATKAHAQLTALKARSAEQQKLAQESRTLQQRLAEVEAKNKTLTEAHQAESTTRERIERELVEAQSQATKAHAQLTALKARSAEQQKLAQESRTLQQRLAEVEAKNKTLTEAHQAESTTRERIERELVEAQSQATKAHAQLTALKARSAEQQKLAQESRTLQQRLAEVEAKNKTLTEAHQAESTTRERIERELVEAQSQATKAHAQLTALKARSAEQQKLAQESRTLQQRLAEVEAKNKTLTEAHQAESTTRERIERELVEAQSQATKAHAQLTALKARSAEQQKLAQESRTLQQRLAEVEAKNKTLTEAHQAESTTRERIERELVEAQSQATKAHAQLTALKVHRKDKAHISIQEFFSNFNEKKILSSNNSQRSYVVGLMFSEGIKNKRKEIENVGLKTDGEFFVAGLVHGYLKTPALSIDKTLDVQKGISKMISESVNRNLAQAILQIEKEVKSKKILSSSTDRFIFTLDKQGTGGYKQGKTVVYNVTEFKLNGELIRSSENNKVVYNSDTPDYIRIAIKEAKRGGVISVYGLAVNVYGNNIPSGIFADTPVRLQFHLM